MKTPKYFRIEPSGDALIFSAVVNIDGLMEDEVREECDALLQQVAQNKAKHAIVDLGALDYFGSILLELMVVVWKNVSPQGGKLVVCNVSQVGREILQTAKFDSIWPIVASREDALKELGQ